MPLDEIVVELEQRGWTPLANDVPDYVRHVLVREVELFEPVGEGTFRVR
jgi:transcriptional regulator of NAD metabolism